MTEDKMNAAQLAAFEEWRQLRNKAEQSQRLDDAHAAGKAYGRFFDTYVSNLHRPSAKVVALPIHLSDSGGAA